MFTLLSCPFNAFNLLMFLLCHIAALVLHVLLQVLLGWPLFLPWAKALFGALLSGTLRAWPKEAQLPPFTLCTPAGECDGSGIPALLIQAGWGSRLGLTYAL